MSEAAMVRAATYGDGWFALPVPPDALAAGRARVTELAAERGRPPPTVTVNLLAAITGDPALPDRAALVRLLTDPDGTFGIPEEALDAVLVSGGPAEVADRLAALADAGAQRIVASFAAGDWRRQTELLAEAGAQLP
jgi:alkanesulfonate monooxygenase SsuD/methylene tetrahydromethanopterin reductase-like flavin-dependent oxidoreductase (luciferase family)